MYEILNLLLLHYSYSSLLAVNGIKKKNLVSGFEFTGLLLIIQYTIYSQLYEHYGHCILLHKVVRADKVQTQCMLRTTSLSSLPHHFCMQNIKILIVLRC